MDITLSDTQKKVVDYDGGNLIVIAGAGSGKTRVLTERIKRLISTLKKGEKVLAITFSNKATEELRERLIKTVGEERLNECAYIGTTHKFCLDIVTSRGSVIGLPDELHICESFNDRLQIFKEAIENIPEFKAKYVTNNVSDNEKQIKGLLEQLSAAKRNLKSARDYEQKPLVKGLFEEYEYLLLQQGVIDFDDILRYSYQILTERESIARLYQKIYKYICVDEAQDLNKAQYEVIKAIAGDTAVITMVGDPNQSIYGFNGSDSKYLEKIFKKEYNAEEITLVENYRSSKKVIEAAMKIENSLQIYGVCKYDGEFEISEFSNEQEEAKYIASKIKYLIENGHSDVENNIITLEKCAIIARNRYVFKYVEELFTENNIEYTLKVSAKGSFASESDFIKAFELGIRLLVNKKDKIHLNELSNLMNLRKSYANFEELRTEIDLSTNWKVMLQKLNIAWDILCRNENEIKFQAAIAELRDFIDSRSDSINIDEHEKLLISEDLEQWKSNWNIFGRNSSPGERSLGNFVRSVSLGNTFTPVDKGVVFTTVHMSKGLEYDVVFIMGLNEGIFPDYRAINSYNNYNDEKQLIEEKHNIFVAITRSKRLCYLTYPLSKTTPWGIKPQSPSRYILELDGK